MQHAQAHEIAVPWNEGEEANFTKLLLVDGCCNARARFHQLDIWHGVHLGIGKSFIASAMDLVQKATPVEERFKLDCAVQDLLSLQASHAVCHKTAT